MAHLASTIVLYKKRINKLYEPVGWLICAANRLCQSANGWHYTLHKPIVRFLVN